MTKSFESSTPRREFLGQIAASAIVLAGAACAAPMSVAQTSAATPKPVPAPTGGANRAAAQTQWDDSWFGRLTAKHKAVFDSPEIAEDAMLGARTGDALHQRHARRARRGPSDVQTVIVIRHHAIPFAFNDAMWEKYEIGKDQKIKGEGEEWATKNPFAAAP